MIEIVYDKNEVAANGEQGERIRLPKNIRQVGAPSGNRKVYIEDYVYTYLNQLAKPCNTYSRGAILLGEYKKNETGEYLFISGAIEAQNLELDLDETVFTNETWSEIYDNIKNYFPELSVVGWFLSRLGFSTSINDKISKTHLDNFSGRDKTLYIIDSLEGEDAFYLYEGNGLRKQLGYYIYYTKNEAMQNYMISQNSEENEEISEVDKKDEELLATYKTMQTKNKERAAQNTSQLAYVASAILTVAVLALGVTVLNSYDRMKEMEVALNRMELTVSANKEKQNEDNVETNVIEVGANVTTETENSVSTENVTEAEDLQATDTENELSLESSSETTEEPEVSVVMKNDTPVYYTVQAGDTLTSISMEMYQSPLYVELIVQANALENGDAIFVGQQIVIPSLPRE